VPSTHQEERRRESWAALRAAAFALVEERGFAAVTVDDVAAAAGVSRRTFFNHFPTKAAALFDPAEGDARRLRELLAGAEPGTAVWPALRDALVAFTAGETGTLAVRRRLVAEDPELDAYLRTAHRHVGVAVEEWSRARVPDDPFEAALVAETAAAVLMTAFLSWHPDTDPDLFPRLVASGFDRVGAGFGQAGG
jgi:AcrR family transcriptional regulator